MGQIGNKVESVKTCYSARPYPFLQLASGQKDDVNGFSSFSDICFMLVYIFQVILRVNCLTNLHVCIDAREKITTLLFGINLYCSNQIFITIRIYQADMRALWFFCSRLAHVSSSAVFLTTPPGGSTVARCEPT
jgi:hypothetical protein